MTTLADFRALVRKDLRDEDASDYRWTDGEIDRHVEHAVRTYSHYQPIEQQTALATTSGSREVSLASLTGRLGIARVEYPTGHYPPAYVPFAVWGDVVRLVTDQTPSGDNCSVCWLAAQTVDASSSTIPAAHEDLIATGAAGYAAEAWASYATNRVNVDPQAVDHYAALAARRLIEFRRSLEELTAFRRVRLHQLYSEAVAAGSRLVDWGP